MPKPIKSVAFLLGTALTVAVATPIVTSSVAVDVVTYHNDNARTGQNLNETTLATVNTSTFGKTGFFPVDGKVDAQPLFLSGLAIPGMGTHDVLYVATEHDSVYALDAASGGVLWRASMLGSGETTSDARGCSQVTPEISTSSGLAVADYFATFDTVAKSNGDTDLGSGGTLVLPDLIDGTGQTRHLAVGAGKDADIYVVDRDSMGKWNSSSNLIYQDISGALGNSVFSTPAYFNNTVYYGAVGTTLKAFSIVNARLSTAAVSASPGAFTYPGTTPGVSAAGGANAIVWAVENTSPAVLHAFDARDLSRELYNSNQAPAGRDAFGAGNKFITPTIANGHVYVGTTNGVARFGSLLAGPSAPTGLRIL